MNKKENKQEEKQTNMLKEIISTIAYFAFVMLAVYLILTYVGQRTVVVGHSMDNTLQDGQNLVMDKISYRFHDPERFDIIIFPGPNTQTGEGLEPYIKRVIALPGETVQIIDGHVWVNDKLMEEDIYGKDDYIENPGILNEPYTLGEDEYFCMGDNRAVSYDCRYEDVGMVHKDEFIGKAWIRIWPLSEFGSIPAQGKE